MPLNQQNKIKNTYRHYKVSNTTDEFENQAIQPILDIRESFIVKGVTRLPPQGNSNTIKSFVRKTKYKYIKKIQTDIFLHLNIYKKLKKYLRQTNKVVSISAHSCFC